MHTDNPAARLLHILEEGKRHPIQTKNKDAWAKLLNVEGNNLALLTSRLGKVMELPQQIINQMAYHFPNQKDSHKHWSSTVNNALASQNLNGRWDEFISKIDGHTINYLKMTVDLLDMKENTKLLTDTQLSDIRKEISNILAEIIAMEIDANVKKYIVRYLRKILISIEEYQISGASPILEAIESLYGHAVFDEKYREVLKDDKDMADKLFSALSIVSSMITVAVGLPVLPETINYFLDATK